MGHPNMFVDSDTRTGLYELSCSRSDPAIKRERLTIVSGQ